MKNIKLSFRDVASYEPIKGNSIVRGNKILVYPNGENVLVGDKIDKLSAEWFIRHEDDGFLCCETNFGKVNFFDWKELGMYYKIKD